MSVPLTGAGDTRLRSHPLLQSFTENLLHVTQRQAAEKHNKQDTRLFRGSGPSSARRLAPCSLPGQPAFPASLTS